MLLSIMEHGTADVDVFCMLPGRSKAKVGQLTLILAEKRSQKPAQCSNVVLRALVKGKLSFDKLTQEDLEFAAFEEVFSSVRPRK